MKISIEDKSLKADSSGEIIMLSETKQCLSLQLIGLCLILMWTTMISTGVQGCSCALMHPQVHFCKADFVIKAKIRKVLPVYRRQQSDSKKKFPRFWKSEVRIIRTFKGQELMANSSKYYVYTPGDSGACGISFNRNQKYLITGRITGGKLFTTMCNYNGLWESLTKWQRRGFTTLFKDICDCQVEVCFNDNCKHYNVIENSEDTCSLDMHLDRQLCHIKYSRCSRRSHGQCEWNRTGDFKRCRAKTNKIAWSEP